MKTSAWIHKLIFSSGKESRPKMLYHNFTTEYGDNSQFRLTLHSFMTKTISLWMGILINIMQYFMWDTQNPYIITVEVSDWHVLPTVKMFSPDILDATVNCDAYIRLVNNKCVPPYRDLILTWFSKTVPDLTTGIMCFSLCATLSVKGISCHL
jgi:hypothetical protein